MQGLREHIEQLERELRKSHLKANKMRLLEEDYQKLTENFNKSEFIRTQQKDLITALREEVETLKTELQS